MGRNGEPAALVNDLANFAGRFSFQVGQFGADAKKMAIGGRDFDSWQNEKAVDWLAVDAHQTFFEHVSDRVAGVVIGHGDAVQTFRLRSGDQILGTGNAVPGKERVSVKIEVKRHRNVDLGSEKNPTPVLRPEHLVRMWLRTSLRLVD